MNQKIIIRRFEDYDADKVSGLIIENLMKKNVLEFGKSAVTLLSEYYLPQQLQESAKNEELHVASDGSDIVGTASLDNGRIRNVFVKMGRHRQGIGTQLVRYCEEVAAHQGKLNVFLFANLAAVDFYQDLGYSIIEEKTETIGAASLNMMLMVKRLPHTK